MMSEPIFITSLFSTMNLSVAINALGSESVIAPAREGNVHLPGFFAHPGQLVPDNGGPPTTAGESLIGDPLSFDIGQIEHHDANLKFLSHRKYEIGRAHV